MSQNLLLIDTLLRGATIGAQMLIAFAFLRPWPPGLSRGLGAAFIVSAGCYIANSSPQLVEAIGLVRIPVGILSITSPGTEHPLYREKFAEAVRKPLDGSAVQAIGARPSKN